MKYILAVLVENRPGVLTHISGLISRRAFNIESIAAGPTEEVDTTRITIGVEVEDEFELEQVVNQLSKLVNVIKIANITYVDSIQRELALIKVRANKANRSDLVDVVEIFRAKIVDVNRETLVVELSGEESKIDALCEVLTDFGILEIVRTGRIAISRGPVPAKDM
ncbi:MULTISPECIES: acetolactate synthase small subunit [Pelosinus]|jgi:acetolactate synthase-1/3 small subunit|uniref:Acetolactate synthase small subunit n=1 Tax=Pelosinus fermentans B4 TaxID=1149862 RepID=I9LIP1_9FIRM|nr:MULTISPECIES: acetolactate synthase small subunit [Pelosinus]EIW20369.1 acetolactate synthase, small subunit [Pelosinus fermentans B4]EIW25572.1 acetolactate synthase, small subunit [Pelosinus fermentans A11]OAM93294.1 acetolactate synthase, small subunit [Pelosinus fermentans DSM 17108]SDQ73014.1 acetolactate synthase, small subunit [Pelosinus fermentans]